MPSSTIRTLTTVLTLLTAASIAIADPIPVRFTQGTLHGFLVIRSQSGASLGYGEITQLIKGDRVTAHLVFHFRDGSLDDETTVYTQHETFQLVSDHHIQRGPSFSKPSEITVEANGQVTTITPSKDGTPKTETQHIDLPPDVSNGMIGTLLANVDPTAPPFKVSMVVPTGGKGRLVQLAITPREQAPFTIVGARRKATIYTMKIELGGVAGVIAPIIGKQPPDIVAWVLQGDAPVFVREIGQLAEDGPTVSIEFAGATFSHPTAPKRKP